MLVDIITSEGAKVKLKVGTTFHKVVKRADILMAWFTCSLSLSATLKFATTVEKSFCLCNAAHQLAGSSPVSN